MRVLIDAPVWVPARFSQVRFLKTASASSSTIFLLREWKSGSVQNAFDGHDDVLNACDASQSLPLVQHTLRTCANNNQGVVV